jgi:L-threonylcarbamoyladenylate synthase
LKPPARRDNVLRIDPATPAPEGISKAAGVLSAGGILVFPTRSLYGLGVDAFNETAVEKLFHIKKRPAGKPILILIHDTEQLRFLVKDIPAAVKPLMHRFWPGRLTLVFHAGKEVPKNLTAGTGKIGIRQAGHPVAARLAAAFGRPITGTSANRSGRPGIFRCHDLDPGIQEAVDLVIDAGPLEGGAGSTVIDVTTDPPRILREGAVSAREIFALPDTRPDDTPQSP